MMMKRILYFSVMMLCFAFTACSEYEADKGEHIYQEPEEDKEEVINPEGVKGVLPYIAKSGRYMKNVKGEIVNLHGFTDTYSPYFDQFQWNNYDVAKCLTYKRGIYEGILKAGWKLNFVRLHMDPYWSNKPGQQTSGEGDISAFDMNRFIKYFDEVFLPMADYYISKGCYVVMRPPGVCPEKIEIGGAYHQYLKKVWEYVASHKRVKNNTDIMFELANEPVQIKGVDKKGNSTDYAHWTEDSWRACSIFFQQVVDVIRDAGCTKNMVWLPGLCWQQQYKGYIIQPIKDDNYGFAIHCYPGWYGSKAEESTGEGGGVTADYYGSFKQGWDEAIDPIAQIAPIMVTEIDWAPKKYNKTWGKSTTTAFGQPFKKLADDTGNVSWLFFTTTSEDMRDFKDEPGTPGNYTFLNDPEACIWQMYHWFKEYAEAQ